MRLEKTIVSFALCSLFSRRMRFRFGGLKHKAAILDFNPDRLVVSDLAGQQFSGKRCFHFPLNGPFQGACAIGWVVATLYQVGESFVRELKVDVPLGQTLSQARQLN